MAKNVYQLGLGGWLGVIAVLFILGIVSGVVKLPTQSVAGGTFSPNGGVTSCPVAPATVGFPRLGLIAGYQDQSNNYKNTTAAIAYNVTASPSPGYSYQATVTSSTTYGNTTSLGLQCGKSYVVIFAGGSDSVTNYYPQQLTVGPIGANQTTVPFVALQKMAQLKAPLFSNSTNFGVNVTNVKTGATWNGVTPGQLVTAGSTISNIYMQLRAGAGAYGGSGIELLCAANTIAISSCQFLGPNGQTLPSSPAVYPSTMNVPTGFTVYAQTALPITTWSSTATYQMVIKTTSSFGGNTGVLVGINDLPGFIQNGVLSFPTGGVDPNTHADIAETLTMLGGTTELTVNALTAGAQAPVQICQTTAGC